MFNAISRLVEGALVVVCRVHVYQVATAGYAPQPLIITKARYGALQSCEATAILAWRPIDEIGRLLYL